MKALSIRQPWAWAILVAGKRIENRSTETRYRGEFLIHASSFGALRPRQLGQSSIVPYADQREVIEDVKAVAYKADAAGVSLPKKVTYPDILGACGGIVGRARIVDCIEQSDSPWFCGPFGWVLADVEPLPFVPCKGALGLWNVPADVLAQIGRAA